MSWQSFYVHLMILSFLVEELGSSTQKVVLLQNLTLGYHRVVTEMSKPTCIIVYSWKSAMTNPFQTNHMATATVKASLVSHFN
jgi:hypothetical protein